MPLQGILQTGKHYRIVVANDTNTPGVVATAILWIPPPGLPPTSPVVDATPPGMQALHAGLIPTAQMLLLDFDLPDKPTAKITVSVEQDGAVVASGTEPADTEWTFLVVP